MLYFIVVLTSHGKKVQKVQSNNNTSHKSFKSYRSPFKIINNNRIKLGAYNNPTKMFRN